MQIRKELVKVLKQARKMDTMLSWSTTNSTLTAKGTKIQFINKHRHTILMGNHANKKLDISSRQGVLWLETFPILSIIFTVSVISVTVNVCFLYLFIPMLCSFFGEQDIQWENLLSMEPINLVTVIFINFLWLI